MSKIDPTLMSKHCSMSFKRSQLFTDIETGLTVKKAMEEKTKDNFICTLRLIYFISCGFIFVYLSEGLYQNFVGSKVILTASDLAIGHQGLTVPVLSICSQDPFKNYSKPMFTLEEYMENSMNVTESIVKGYSLVRFEGDNPTYYVSLLL